MAFKRYLLITIFAIISLLAIFSVRQSYAQPIDGIGTISLPGSISTTPEQATGKVSSYIGTIMNVVFFFALVALLAYLAYGGIQWITSGGDKKGSEGARQTMTNAAIGIILMACMYAISIIMANFIGADTALTPNEPGGNGATCTAPSQCNSSCTLGCTLDPNCINPITGAQMCNLRTCQGCSGAN